MSVVSSASWEVSIQQSSQPTSRTTSASLCSTPKAPGSSRARLPTSATIGTRSGGVTTRHSIAYIQPTPVEPQKTRAPTVDACLTISNWLCSPSATMYSATSWPPEILSSLSASCAAGAAWVTTAIALVLLYIRSPRTAGPQPRDVLTNR